MKVSVTLCWRVSHQGPLDVCWPLGYTLDEEALKAVVGNGPEDGCVCDGKYSDGRPSGCGLNWLRFYARLETLDRVVAWLRERGYDVTVVNDPRKMLTLEFVEGVLARLVCGGQVDEDEAVGLAFTAVSFLKRTSS